MEVRLYNPQDRNALLQLNLDEYPFMAPWFESRFHTLYECKEQAERAKIFIATENNELAGAFSYIHWPIHGSPNPDKTFMMLGLVVSPKFRGKGVFLKILDRLDQEAIQDGADIMCGFPVPISNPGFVKKGWNNLFDLTWYIKPINALAMLKSREFNAEKFSTATPQGMAADAYLQTAPSTTFWEYRESLMPDWNSYWYSENINDRILHLNFRIQTRMRMQEAVIGKIYAGNAAAPVIKKFLQSFQKALIREGSISLLSTAINDTCKSETQKAISSQLFRTKRKIHFINKTYTGYEHGMNAKAWNIMRADIETW
jgi:GNAT superfamily N-acetyltransferase